MQNRDNNTNFWISYADLMAGLLFVFILLIGAIIVKYALLEDESNSLEKSLEKEKLALEKSKKELAQKEQRLENIVRELDIRETRINKIQEEYDFLDKKLKDKIEENNKLKQTITNSLKEVQEYGLKNKKLETTLEKIEKQNATLKEKRASLEQLLIDKEKRYEELLLASQNKIKELSEENFDKSKLTDILRKKNDELEGKLSTVQKNLASSQKEHTKLATELEDTKKKIKNLTGIKIRVITLLKEKLGKNIQIDPISGNLTLSSKVLFDEGKSTLKPSSKVFLKNAVYDYFETILTNNEINKYIDKIAIVGHTNSVGGFLYNLDLSQKRALSVMEFLLSLDFKNKKKLQELLVASGRSYLDPIFNDKGKEDKEASRRIEIKLNIKNEEAIKEIANILE